MENCELASARMGRPRGGWIEMATIYTIHPYEEDHLAEVMTEAERIGSVTVRAYVVGGTVFALEGVHRIEAASRLGLPLIVQPVSLDDPFDHDLQDVDSDATAGDVYDYAYSTGADGGMYSDEDFASVAILD